MGTQDVNSYKHWILIVLRQVIRALDIYSRIN